jgi:hypothetical protein
VLSRNREKVQLRPDMKLPQYFGHLTNDLVWRRSRRDCSGALKERREERGRPSNKLFQWTSEELGKPELLIHLGLVVGLMKLHTDYEGFHKQPVKLRQRIPSRLRCLTIRKTGRFQRN